MKKSLRQLYQCLHAKVKGDKIACAKGHPLSLLSEDGSIGLIRVWRHQPLEMTICQKCLDYDEMGPPLRREDRGWPVGDDEAKRVSR